MIKKTILIDLDGVLNKYNGEYDSNYIPPILDGAFDFIKSLSKTYRVVIYIENITNIKEPSFLIIDDRCINFKGNFEELKSQIDNFKIWYK